MELFHIILNPNGVVNILFGSFSQNKIIHRKQIVILCRGGEYFLLQLSLLHNYFESNHWIL